MLPLLKNVLIISSLAMPLAIASSSHLSTAPHGHYAGNRYPLDHSGLIEAQSIAITRNYLNMWNTGNFSAINAILDPNVVYYQDRIPLAMGQGGSIELPITNSSAWEMMARPLRSVLRTFWIR